MVVGFTEICIHRCSNLRNGRAGVCIELFKPSKQLEIVYVLNCSYLRNGGVCECIQMLIPSKQREIVSAFLALA